MRMRSRTRGFVLMVTLGMLALLSILATTFVILSRTEMQTSSNYVLLVRASMLAISGIDSSLARLRTPGAVTRNMEYGGEDWNGLREATGTADGDADDRNGNSNGVVDVEACDLRYARRPSFFIDADNDGAPDLFPINEAGVLHMRGFSGRLPGTFHADGDTFVLKITDVGAMVSINQKGAGYRKLYENLGQVAFNPPVIGLGAKIQDHQPYTAVSELVTKGALTQAEFDVLEPFVTVWAQEDPTTIKPDPQSDKTVRPENLRRQDGIEPRAPVNVNAADFVVLKSCLLGLSGYALDRHKPKKEQGVIDAAKADLLARAIVVARAESFTDANANGRWDAGEAYADLNSNGRYDGPFRTWKQFEAFVADQPGFKIKGHGNAYGAEWKFRSPLDVVMANVNPNTVLNTFHPDPHVYKTVDKADLIGYTTEFCFESNGYYVIRSLGRVTDPQFVAQAEREIEVVAKLYETVKLTTQEDFEKAAVRAGPGGVVPAGMELSSPDVMTLPEEVGDIAPESYVDVNHDGRFGPGDTFTDANGDGMRDGPAIYDGQLTLRPADPPTTQPWGDAAANIAFRALFNDSPTVRALGPDEYPSLAGDLASPTAAAGIPLAAGDLRTNVDRGGSLLRDISGANDYPDIFPNGLNVSHDAEETVYWNSVLNWPVGEGSVSFWLKPEWTSRPEGNQYKDILALNQQFSLDPNRGRIALLSAVHFGPKPAQFNLDSEWYGRSHSTKATEVADDTGWNPPPFAQTKYKLQLDRRWEPGQWYHFAMSYTNQIQWTAYMDADPFRALNEQNLHNADTPLGNPHVTYNHITLGSNKPWWDKIGNGVYDDVVIYRSKVPNTDVGLTPAWRYQDTGFAGYGDWVGKIDLPASAKIRSIAWTEYRPEENYQAEALSSTAGVARQRRPDVHLSYRRVSDAAWFEAPRTADPDGFDGGAFTPDKALGVVGNQSLLIRLRFDRNGQDPFRNSPTVDDVTITYSRGGASILSWRFVQ